KGLKRFSRDFIIIIIISSVACSCGILWNSAIYEIDKINKKFQSGLHVDPDTFMSLDSVRLEEYATKFERLMELYHFPFNLSGNGEYLIPLDVVFDIPSNISFNVSTQLLDLVDPFNTSDPLNRIKRYNGNGHAIVYAGHYMVGEAFRFALARRLNSAVDINQSREMIKRLVGGIKIISEVSGTGACVRYALPDTAEARNLFAPHNFQESLDSEHLFLKVSYNNQSWWIESGTSLDCFIGLFLGLGFSYYFLDDDPESLEIKNEIKAIVNRVLDYYIKNNWRFVDIDGKTHTAGHDLREFIPFDDARMILSFLQVGRLCDFDRWDSVYQEYLYQRNYIELVGRQEKSGAFQGFASIGNYFNINLAMSCSFILTFLEKDPALKSRYNERLIEPLYRIVRLHRNAYFDLVHAACHALFDDSTRENESKYALPISFSISDESLAFIKNDVIDCLIRFTYRKFPDRNYPVNALTINQEQNNVSIPGAKYPDLRLVQADDFDSWLVELEPGIVPGNTLNNSEPVDLRPSENWIWEESPFKPQASGNGHVQNPAGDFMTCYWIGRFLGLF
ncbi:MAG: hypothetical protein ACTSRA_16400, partial [Promethearchaeota archaeon]